MTAPAQAATPIATLQALWEASNDRAAQLHEGGQDSVEAGAELDRSASALHWSVMFQPPQDWRDAEILAGHVAMGLEWALEEPGDRAAPDRNGPVDEGTALRAAIDGLRLFLIRTSLTPLYRAGPPWSPISRVAMERERTALACP